MSLRADRTTAALFAHPSGPGLSVLGPGRVLRRCRPRWDKIGHAGDQLKRNQSTLVSIASFARGVTVIDVVPAGRFDTLKLISLKVPAEPVPSSPGAAITGPVAGPAWNSSVNAAVVARTDAYRKVT